MKTINNAILRDPSKEGILPIFDKNSRMLILGSITSIDGMKKGFYYASKRNQFWELLDFCLGLENRNSFLNLKEMLQNNYDNFDKNQISKEEFEENKNQIKGEFRNKLLSHNLAMCDIFKSCYFAGNSSLDCDIILNNTNFPFETYKDYLQENIQNSNIEYVFTTSVFVTKLFKKMQIEGNYELITLISPSPRRGSINEKKLKWKQDFDLCFAKENNIAQNKKII